MGDLALECRLLHTVRPASESSPNGLLVRVRAPVGAASSRVALPLHTVVLLDASGAMEGPWLDAAREAIVAFANELGPSSRLAVLACDSRCRTVLPLQPAPPATVLGQALARVRIGEGLELGRALLTARDTLTRARDPGAQRVLVLTATARIGAPPREEPGAPDGTGAPRVHAVGLGPSFDDAYLARLAGRGAGRLVAITDRRGLPPGLGALGRAMAGAVLTDVEVTFRPLRGNRLRSDDGNPRGTVRLHDLAPGGTRETWIPLEHDSRPAGQFVAGELRVTAIDRERGRSVEDSAAPAARFSDTAPASDPDPEAHSAYLRATACAWIERVLAHPPTPARLTEQLRLAAELLARASRPRAEALLLHIADAIASGAAPPTNQLLRSIVSHLAGGMDVED